MASEKQKQRATAVGSGDLLGHKIVITQNSLANQNAQPSRCSALARGLTKREQNPN
jgi:hypothetical protein